jgi:hypothetical protein
LREVPATAPPTPRSASNGHSPFEPAAHPELGASVIGTDLAILGDKITIISQGCPPNQARRPEEGNTHMPETSLPRAKDARWPFVMLFLFMWAGMIGTALNTDPIKFDFTVATLLGLVAVLGIVACLAIARWRNQRVFAFERRSVLGNLAWHVFLLTGIVFITFLFFDATVQILILGVRVPLFESGCAVSQSDTSLFVWNAMAKGAFKVLADYLDLPVEACTPSDSWVTTGLSQTIRGFTAIVVVWYVLSFLKSWYAWLRLPRASP